MPCVRRWKRLQTSNFIEVKSWTFILFLLSFIYCQVGYSAFDREKEFPNYFKEMVPSTTSGDSVSTEKAEFKIEQALDSVIKRIQIPHVKDKELVHDDFFTKLQEIAKTKDPGAQVYVGGGVVRSLLAYVYERISKAKAKDPHLSTDQILDHIIHSKSKIPSMAALGIGSDLDIYVVPSASGQARYQEISRDMSEFINSAEKFTGLDSIRSRFKYSIVPIADVKDYHEQMKRTMSQGGSTLDWLALSLGEMPTGTHRMINPARDKQVFQRFILGEYDYLAPEGSPDSTLKDKQVVRGLRPLLELPFIDLSSSGHKQLSQELKTLSGPTLSSDAVEQFQKMTRNAHFWGGHNRFYFSDDDVSKLALDIARGAVKDAKGIPLIPEFIMNENPKNRVIRDKTLDSLLMPVDQFIEQQTDGGKLYHGTPDLNGVLSIVRNGFVASTPNTSNGKSTPLTSGQGAAAFGRGAYTTKDRNFARDYGIPLEFELKGKKDLVEPRILDWEKVKDDPKVQAAVKAATDAGRNPFEYLASQYKIDIILNSYPLIQNSGILRRPKTPADLIRLQEGNLDVAEQEFQKTQASGNLTIKDISKYLLVHDEARTYHELGKLLGSGQLKALPDISAHYQQLLTQFPKGSTLEKRQTLEFFSKLGSPDPSVYLFLLGVLDKETDVTIKSQAANVLGHVGERLPNFFLSSNSNSSRIQATLIRLAKTESDPLIKTTAIEHLGKFKSSDPEIHKIFIDALLSDKYSSKPLIARAAADALAQVESKDPGIQEQLLGAWKYATDYWLKENLEKALIRSSPLSVANQSDLAQELNKFSVAPVISILRHSQPLDPKVQVVVAQSLAGKRHDPDIDDLLSLLTHPHSLEVQKKLIDQLNGYSHVSVDRIILYLRKTKPLHPEAFQYLVKHVSEHWDYENKAAHLLSSLISENETEREAQLAAIVESFKISSGSRSTHGDLQTTLKEIGINSPTVLRGLGEQLHHHESSSDAVRLMIDSKVQIHDLKILDLIISSLRTPGATTSLHHPLLLAAVANPNSDTIEYLKRQLINAIERETAEPSKESNEAITGLILALLKMEPHSAENEKRLNLLANSFRKGYALSDRVRVLELYLNQYPGIQMGSRSMVELLNEVLDAEKVGDNPADSNYYKEIAAKNIIRIDPNNPKAREFLKINLAKIKSEPDKYANTHRKEELFFLVQHAPDYPDLIQEVSQALEENFENYPGEKYAKTFKVEYQNFLTQLKKESPRAFENWSARLHGKRGPTSDPANNCETDTSSAAREFDKTLLDLQEISTNLKD